MSKIYVLWGTKINNPDWQEEIITEQSEENKHILDDAQRWAQEQGYNRFRILIVNNDNLECPDFAKTINNIGG